MSKKNNKAASSNAVISPVEIAESAAQRLARVTAEMESLKAQVAEENARVIASRQEEITKLAQSWGVNLNELLSMLTNFVQRGSIVAAPVENERTRTVLTLEQKTAIVERLKLDGSVKNCQALANEFKCSQPTIWNLKAAAGLTKSRVAATPATA